MTSWQLGTKREYMIVFGRIWLQFEFGRLKRQDRLLFKLRRHNDYCLGSHLRLDGHQLFSYSTLQQQLSHLSQVLGVGYCIKRELCKIRHMEQRSPLIVIELYAFIKTFSLYILSYHLHPCFL